MPAAAISSDTRAPEALELAQEFLHTTLALSSELEKAMTVLASNSLNEFRESVARQEVLSARLHLLASQLAKPVPTNRPAVPERATLRDQISEARAHLEQVNFRYAKFLQQSTDYMNVIAGLCREFTQDRQPLSCEV